jgi:hypothetical protein
MYPIEVRHPIEEWCPIEKRYPIRLINEEGIINLDYFKDD